METEARAGPLHPARDQPNNLAARAATIPAASAPVEAVVARPGRTGMAS